MENSTSVPIATGANLCSVSLTDAMGNLSSWLIILSFLPLIISIFVYLKYYKNIYWKLIVIIFSILLFFGILGLAFLKFILWYFR